MQINVRNSFFLLVLLVLGTCGFLYVWLDKTTLIALVPANSSLLNYFMPRYFRRLVNQSSQQDDGIEMPMLTTVPTTKKPYDSKVILNTNQTDTRQNLRNVSRVDAKENTTKSTGRTFRVEQIKDATFVQHEPCPPFPAPPAGITWPEDIYANEPPLLNDSEVSSGSKSRVILEGSSTMTLGSIVKVKVTVFDRLGRPKTKGGDLVRVWMKEPRLHAASVGSVEDHGNGRYTATLRALWVGTPTIMAAIILSREQVVTIFKRRLICPPPLFDFAVFLKDGTKTQTPCNTGPYIWGYTDICNMTQLNYDHPWYCGKPRAPGFTCSDWQLISDVNMWNLGHETKALPPIEFNLINKHNGPELVPSNITLNVTKGNDNLSRIEPKSACNEIKDFTVTWNMTSPVGYMFQRKWISVHCFQPVTSQESLIECAFNLSMIIIGDSTGRQLFDRLTKLTTKHSSNTSLTLSKHAGNFYKLEKFDLNVFEVMHELPFSTTNNDHTLFKSFKERLQHIKKGKKTIVVLHMFSHFLPYHSNVFHSKWAQARTEISEFIQTNPDVYIVIKGPHTSAFRKEQPGRNTVLTFSEVQVEKFSQMLYTMFAGLHSRIFYLNTYDATVATEQFFIHPEDYIIDEQLFTIFSYICPK